jgi:hypothetical protein
MCKFLEFVASSFGWHPELDFLNKKLSLSFRESLDLATVKFTCTIKHDSKQFVRTYHN